MKLFITAKIPKRISEKLKENFTLIYNDNNEPLTKEDLIKSSKDVDAILCALSDKIDKDIINNAKNLKIIANYGAGYDNIDIEAAKRKNIIVTNAPAPSSAVSTAELTFGLILAVARKIVAGDKFLRSGKFKAWRPTFGLGMELKDKTLGIIGLGNIGMNLAKRALAFDMKVVYNSRNRKESFEKEYNIKYLSKDELLKTADIISCHTAYVEELHHMIGKKEFEIMKKSAIFINASRGPIVDEEAFAQALINKEILAGALDVYEFEPHVNEKLLKLNNLVLTPHLGNATYKARLEMGENALMNLLQFKEGKVCQNKVN